MSWKFRSMRLKGQGILPLEKKHTGRGFAIYEFEDRYGVDCSLQKSSLAFEDCVWLGANTIGLKEFKSGHGWTDVELENTIEHHFNANNRMHLTREQVSKLLPILKKFVDTGEI